MKYKGFYKNFILICIICFSSFFAVNLYENKQNIFNYVNTSNLSEISYKIEEPSSQFINFNTSNDNFSDVSYESYTKGMKVVNVIFNFVNYQDDTSNKFTQAEINNIINTFENDANMYFERMSQGYVSINIDYVCCTAPNSYDYYLNLDDSNYTIESSIFNNSINSKLDYNGSIKTFKFDEYHFRVNAFAGNSGEWSTFLWPHAYSASNLILMMEYKQGNSMASSTLCHEMMHTFGVYDLYAYTGSSQNFSAQNLDIMGSSQKNAATNAYFRQKVGWITSSIYDDDNISPIEEIPSAQKGTLTLDLYPNCTSDYTKTIAYKFGENSDNDEFFMIEYKIKNYDSFESNVPKTSVVIYRVNPNAVRGNSYGNDGNSYYNEVIFMGDSYYDITTSTYTNSCLLTSGMTYGTRGLATTTSLVYSSDKGKANLFNGENSGISVTIDNLSNSHATISITFKEDKTNIDLQQTKWNYKNSFTYDGKSHSVELINIPSNITINYNGNLNAINAGKYIVTITLVYDEYKYALINNNFSTSLQWEITPANISITIDNKSSKYGEPLLPLTYNLSKGTIYNDDTLNISLTKQNGLNVGTYDITCSSTNTDYNILPTNGIYTIIPRIINIKVLDQTFNISNFNTIDNTKFEILDGSDTIVERDDLKIVLQAIGFTNKKAGNYTLSATSNNPNYSLVVSPGTLQIDEVQPPQPDKNNNIPIIVGLTLASIVLISTLATIIAVRRRRRRLNRWQKYLFT